MERYNKSTIPENAEKYFYDPPGIRTHDLGNTAQHWTTRHPHRLRYRDNPNKNCSNSADIGIG